MRIEMKREAELAKRKGQTWKTLLAILWLAATFAGSYFITGWLLEEEYINLSFFYQTLRIPGNISESTVKLGLVAAVFLAFQFIVLMFIAVLSPSAKRRSGVPRADSDDPDPYDKTINYH